MLTDHEHHVTNETHTINLMYLPKFGLSSLLGKPTSGHPTLCFHHQPLMHTVGICAYASCTICFQPVCCSWSFLGPFIRALFFFSNRLFFSFLLHRITCISIHCIQDHPFALCNFLLVVCGRCSQITAMAITAVANK